MLKLRVVNPRCADHSRIPVDSRESRRGHLLVDELLRRHGPGGAARRLELADAGELLTVAVELDALRPPENN